VEITAKSQFHRATKEYIWLTNGNQPDETKVKGCHLKYEKQKFPKISRTEINWDPFRATTRTGKKVHKTFDLTVPSYEPGYSDIMSVVFLASTPNHLLWVL